MDYFNQFQGIKFTGRNVKELLDFAGDIVSRYILHYGNDVSLIFKPNGQQIKIKSGMYVLKCHSDFSSDIQSFFGGSNNCVVLVELVPPIIPAQGESPRKEPDPGMTTGEMVKKIRELENRIIECQVAIPCFQERIEKLEGVLTFVDGEPMVDRFTKIDYRINSLESGAKRDYDRADACQGAIQRINDRINAIEQRIGDGKPGGYQVSVSSMRRTWERIERLEKRLDAVITLLCPNSASHLTNPDQKE